MNDMNQSWIAHMDEDDIEKVKEWASKHAIWTIHEVVGVADCSACGKSTPIEIEGIKLWENDNDCPSFCPHCGARVVGVEKG